MTTRASSGSPRLCDDDAGQLGLAPAVVDHRDLDES